MKIVIAGVPYSANLGDGLIASILRSIITERRPDVEIVHLDLANRQDLAPTVDAEAGSRLRVTALHLHSYGPKSILDQGYGLYKQASSRLMIDEWSNTLDGSDLLLIGPGQLFSARTANFPAKLELLGRALGRCTSAPSVKLVGCGVDTSGSRASKRMLVNAISGLNISSALFRDATSASRFRALPGVEGISVEVAPDIAVAADVLAQGDDAHIDLTGAVYVDAVDLVAYDDVAGRPEAGTDLYRSAIQLALDETKADAVVIGSNGLREDTQAAINLVDNLNLDVDVRLAAPLASPEDIVGRAAASAATVGVRLHALLPALAVGKPMAAPIMSGKARDVFATAYGLDVAAGEAAQVSELSRTQAIDLLDDALEGTLAR